MASFRPQAQTISVLGNQFRVEVTLHKWQMLETAFALRPVLFRALDAPTSAASLCSWSIHHRYGAGDAAQSDLRDFCNRPQRVISHREPMSPPQAAPISPRSRPLGADHERIECVVRPGAWPGLLLLHHKGLTPLLPAGLPALRKCFPVCPQMCCETRLLLAIGSLNGRLEKRT